MCAVHLSDRVIEAVAPAAARSCGGPRPLPTTDEIPAARHTGRREGSQPGEFRRAGPSNARLSHKERNCRANELPRGKCLLSTFGSACTDGFALELCGAAGDLTFLLRASVRRHRRALRIRATKAARVRARVQRCSRIDRSPAWSGIDSMDSSADRPPLTGLQCINIRWKAQGLRFSRPEALESRNGFYTDGHDRPLVLLRSLSQGQLRRCPSSRDNTLLSCPESDHDLRGDSAAEYEQSCSKLAESGSIILTTHSPPPPRVSPALPLPPINRVMPVPTRIPIE